MSDLLQSAIVGAIVTWAAWQVWRRYGPKSVKCGGKDKDNSLSNGSNTAMQSACGTCGGCKGAPSCPPGASVNTATIEHSIHFQPKP